MRDTLIDFMIWYKNNVPIATMKCSEEIVDDYLNRIKHNSEIEVCPKCRYEKFWTYTKVSYKQCKRCGHKWE